MLGRTRPERRERLDTGLLHVFSMEQYAHALREEPEYERNGRNGVTLVKSAGLRVLLEVLRSRDPAVAEHPDRPFPFSHGPSDSQSSLAQRLIVRHLMAGKPIDPLYVEEAMLHVLARLQGADLHPDPVPPTLVVRASTGPSRALHTRSSSS